MPRSMLQIPCQTIIINLLKAFVLILSPFKYTRIVDLGTTFYSTFIEEWFYSNDFNLMR